MTQHKFAVTHVLKVIYSCGNNVHLNCSDIRNNVCVMSDVVKHGNIVYV
jgi:hypothetical protein